MGKGGDRRIISGLGNGLTDQPESLMKSFPTPIISKNRFYNLANRTKKLYLPVKMALQTQCELNRAPESLYGIIIRTVKNFYRTPQFTKCFIHYSSTVSWGERY